MSEQLPIFFSLDTADQIIEIVDYLKEHEIEVAEIDLTGDVTATSEKLIACIQKLVEKCDLGQDIESVLNSIITIMLMADHGFCGPMLQHFCDEISSAKLKSLMKIRLLRNLFIHLREQAPPRYIVYTFLLKLCETEEELELIPCELDEIRKWIVMWQLPLDKIQQLFRLLYQAYHKCAKFGMASKIMLELLNTHTDLKSPKLRDDAQRCIVSHISDPDILIMDQLLYYRPIDLLKDSSIYHLLQIFIKGTLKDYLQWYEHNIAVVESLGLNHDANIHKMRLLTFLSLTSQSQVLSFSNVEEALDIPVDQVEDFVIQTVKAKIVQVKMDQIDKTITITSSIQRTFGRPEWEQLRNTLISWNRNLTSVRSNIFNVLDTAGVEA